ICWHQSFWIRGMMTRIPVISFKVGINRVTVAMPIALCAVAGRGGSTSFERIQELTQAQDLCLFEAGKVADVAAIKVERFDVGVVGELVATEPAEVGLAELIAAARGATAEFDAVRAKRPQDPVAEVVVAMFEDQREGVIAAARGFKIGPVELGI